MKSELLNLKAVPLRSLRLIALLLAAPILLVAFCSVAHADDKENKTKEKKERAEVWVEIRTPHFIVVSDGGEKNARKVLDEFETVRRAFQAAMPNARLSTGIPIRILAARDAQSFAKLFPEFPADKRHTQPNGDYFSGPEKIHIAIRTNVSVHSPYEAIYQSYAHLILKLSYRNLPPWLEEGYANIFGSIAFTDKGVRLARPDPEDLSVLFESPLLPLDIVLRVDRTSPYYTAGDKNTVFFAESHALLHLLLIESQLSGQKTLERYMDMVEHGGDAVKAAREVFGDLNQLQNRLDAYIKLVNGSAMDIALGGESDAVGAPRVLSTAEMDARIGEFWENRGQHEDAKSKLESALEADPSLALAEQTLGFQQLQEKELDEADAHFSKALQLDPNDGLTYFGQGLTAMSRGKVAGAPAKAVAAFEKSAALNPDFAPTWYNLASEYMDHLETLQKALGDAQRAAGLAPGDSGYQGQVNAIQDRIKRSTEAAKVELGGAASLNASPSSADAKSSSKSLEMNSKAIPSATGSSVSSSAVTPAGAVPPPPPLFTPGPRIYSMVGAIAEVICTNAPRIQITLKAQTIVMHLQADDLGKVAVSSAGSAAPVKNISCTGLRGRIARVSYFLVTDKAWDGEIQTIEFRNQL